MQNTGQLPHQLMFHERYLIQSVVGRGGMGCVYRAIDTRELQRVVAIKELRQSHLKPEDLLRAEQRFLQEAAILQKLTPHAHLPTFYEGFTEQGRSYLVMDFIEGKTLQRLLLDQPDHGLSVADTLAYTRQLCEVLSYLHQQSPSVIFRDLKPANVIIAPTNVVYLIDFGIARHFKAGQVMDTEAFGSLGFCAPEVFRGEQTEPRSDLFSLGATLYQCLTGRNPGTNKPTLFDFTPIGQDNAQVPPMLDDLIMRLVATLPEMRPASAEEVINELELIEHSLTAQTEIFQQYNINASQPYYDRRTARAIQWRIEWSRMNKLPGQLGHLWQKTLPFFAVIGSWFLYVYLPFCERVGQGAVDGVRALVVLWRQGRKQFAKLRPHLPARPPNTSPPGGRQPSSTPRHLSLNAVLTPVEEFSDHEQQISLVPLWKSPYLLPFLGILLLTTTGSMALIMQMHTSPVVVAFLLALILLSQVFFAGSKRYIVPSIRAILAAMLLAMLLICATLLSQPVVASLLRSVTVSQVVVSGILLLGVASLLHPVGQNEWLEHVAVSVGAGVCAFVQYMLGPQEMPSLSPQDALALNIFIVLLLSIAAVIPLFLMRRPFSVGDRLSLACSAIFFSWQLMIFGDQAVQPLIALFPWSSIAIKVTLIIALVTLIFLSFYLRTGAWSLVSRLSVLVCMIIGAVMFFFFTALHTGFALTPFSTFLSINPFNPTRLSQFITSSMVIVVSIAIYGLLQRSHLLVVDVMIILFIAFLTQLFQNDISYSHVPYFMVQLKQLTVPVIGWMIVVSLVLLVLSTVLHLVGEKDQVNVFVAGIDSSIILLGNLLLLLTTLVYLFTQWAFGATESDLHITFVVAPPYTYDQLLLVPIALLVLAACFQVFREIHRFLLWLNNRSNRIRLRRTSEKEGVAFTTVDRWVSLFCACCLVFLVQLQGVLSASPLLPRDITSLSPFSLWFVIVGLLTAIIVSLMWPYQKFSKDDRILIRFIHLAVGACVLIAVGAMILEVLHPLLLVAVLITLILLIQHMQMVTRQKDSS